MILKPFNDDELDNENEIEMTLNFLVKFLIPINGGRYKPSWIKMNLKLDNDNEFENDFETWTTKENERSNLLNWKGPFRNWSS